MQGLIRPCRHSLGPELRDRWRAHLCGLCLTLRDEAGQAARALTGYDVLLLSVLVEAQAGQLPTSSAGPCPLRGMRSATVIDARSPAMQLAAAGSLLSGAAGLADKLDDRDLRPALRPIARRARRRFERKGRGLAAKLGMATEAVLDAPASAAAVEAAHGATLDELLSPTGRAVGQLFAQTAAVAGHPQNADGLRRAGDAFGRLVHLADAATDVDADRRARRHNALLATDTAPAQARALALALQATVMRELAGITLVDRSLCDALFDRTLRRTVERIFPARERAARAPVAALGAAVAVAATTGVFGGPPRRRRRIARRYGSPPPGYDQQYDPRYGQQQYDPRYGQQQYDPRYGQQQYDPRYDPRYTYGYGRRSGASCCDILACDCCATMACDEMCGGDCCVCCV